MLASGNITFPKVFNDDVKQSNKEIQLLIVTRLHFIDENQSQLSYVMRQAHFCKSKNAQISCATAQAH